MGAGPTRHALESQSQSSNKYLDIQDLAQTSNSSASKINKKSGSTPSVFFPLSAAVSEFARQDASILYYI
jgi:hypothetical protein